MNIGTRIKYTKFDQQIQNHFSGKVKQIFQLPENFFRILEFPIYFFWICQKCKSNLLSHGTLFHGLKVRNLVNEYKIIFLWKRGESWNFYKHVFSMWASPINFFIKTAKSLNWNNWAIECRYKAQKCQISLTNTMWYSFWESEANLETFGKHVLITGVSYKFVLNFVKSLIRISWTMEYWFKPL